MPSPYDVLGDVPSFSLISEDVEDGERLPLAQASKILGAGGEDRSPHLRWTDFPPQTRSFAVTMFDPDAPSVSGYWHWAVCNIPPDVTSLPSGAGDGSAMPAGSLTVPNEVRLPNYLGAGPPPGHGRHRYCLAVHALDLSRLDVDPQSTPAVMCFAMFGHTLARAELRAWYEEPAEPDSEG